MKPEVGATITPAELAITEKAFMHQVIDLAMVLGWRAYHPWLSIRSERGWPDIALWKPGRFLLAELKAEKGKLTPAQFAMIDGLREAGVSVYVWRPSDWEELIRVLSRGPVPEEAGR